MGLPFFEQQLHAASVESASESPPTVWQFPVPLEDEGYEREEQRVGGQSPDLGVLQDRPSKFQGPVGAPAEPVLDETLDVFLFQL